MSLPIPELEVSLTSIADCVQDWRTGGQAFRVQTFALHYDRLRSQGVAADRPWAAWLAEKVLIGLRRERMKQSVFVGYRPASGLILTRFFSRAQRYFLACCDLLRPVMMESGADLAQADVRPMAFLEGPTQTLYRLYPLPDEEPASGVTLCVDHGALFVAGSTPMTDRDRERYMRSHSAEYVDYEFVPTEPEDVIVAGKKEIVYFNRFVRFV
ncbi:MAG: hypothetical protein COS85_10935 [Armatimonadetes bacterium CG07_land_8_20_14_0_80_59_28]|nr:MAG: hypothetical protein COS85_10935 [Armatimonadetes bacterium CG07_land_8_20_14_0_80_59_28]PIY44971.1 MAG: hypothetical protein COZ05_07075 [Armatimonadetes bacterium CG_4_10_14_3_um_filter_59_10]PJB73690.1 MAG: hypothetical protein CO095_05565 [Armatimonadetes bacterium CG_4_9_14_3_um_filter_58_7]